VVGSCHQATASEDVTVDSSVSVSVVLNCKMKSRAVSRSLINLVVHQKPVYGHIKSRDNDDVTVYVTN
jgi:HEAT repeat protein